MQYVAGRLGLPAYKYTPDGSFDVQVGLYKAVISVQLIWHSQKH